MKLVNVAILAFLTGLTAHAGTENEGHGAGNGGDAVVCKNGRAPVLLDYHEALTRGFSPDLGHDAGIRAMVETAMARFRRVDPVRAARVQKTASAMIDDIEATDGTYDNTRTKTISYTNDNLKDVPDSFEIAIPADCEIQQLVNQQLIPLPFDKTFTIHLPTWKRMDALQKAMTVLHESIYRATILEGGATDSRVARYLNGFFSSNASGSISMSDYFDTLKLMAKRGVTWDYEVDLAKYSPIGKNSTMKINYANSTVKSGIVIATAFLGDIRSTCNGCVLVRDILAPTLNLKDINNNVFQTIPWAVEFENTNGKIMRTLLGGTVIWKKRTLNGIPMKSADSTHEWASGKGDTWLLKPTGHLRIDENGVIRQYSSTQTSWIVMNGTKHRKVVGVNFDETGKFVDLIPRTEP